MNLAPCWVWLIYYFWKKKDAIERYVIDDAVDESDKGIQLKIELVRMNVTLKCSNWKPNKMHVEEMSRQTTLGNYVFIIAFICGSWCMFWFW